MKDIARRLNAYIQKHPFDSGDSDCETVLDQLYQAYAESYESDPKEIKVTQRRLAMVSRSWRYFYIPCPCRITMQCLTSAAACAVSMRERHFWTAYSMAQI